MQVNNGLGTPCGKSPYEVWLNSRIDFFQSAFKQFTSVKNKMKINTNLAVLFTRILQISLNSMNLIYGETKLYCLFYNSQTALRNKAEDYCTLSLKCVKVAFFFLRV